MKREDHSETSDPQAAWEAMTRWRARAVRVILIVIAVLGLPGWGSVIVNGLRNGQMDALLWIYLIVYISILALAFLPRIDYRPRIWGLLLVGYANGIASLARLGLAGSGRLYLLFLPIISTVLIGPRAGLVSALASLAIYGGFILWGGISDPQAWIEAGIALFGFVVAVVVLLARFIQFQMQILRSERRARTELEQAQQELKAYSQTLEQKVLERTARLAEAKEEAEAANRRFEKELLFAGRIQASFMAAELPQIPGWQTGAVLVPARETSGDFYNVFPLPGGRYGILIADVVDKGVGAALIMALCWALLHTYARRFPDEPARVLAESNRRLLRDTQSGQFVTLFYGVLEPRSGELHFANAGHPPPYRLRDQRLLTLDRTGPPLGILEDVGWRESRLDFQTDDLFLLYTDGVTDVENGKGEFFEASRLAAVLKQQSGQPAPLIKQAILDALEQFAGDTPQFDDVTLLVLNHIGRNST